RARLGRRGARQSRRRTLLGQHPGRRRPDVRARRAVDRGEAQDPAARGDAQQPRLSPGGDARAAPRELPQPWLELRRRPGTGRHAHREPRHRIPQARGVDGLVGEGADQGGVAARVGAARSDQGSAVGHARAPQRLDPAPVRERAMRFRLVPFVLVAFAATPAFSADATKGKSAFMKNGCWQCHGELGHGDLARGGGPQQPLPPKPMPLEAFNVFVRTSNGPMPPYPKEILSDADLADIHAYLLSIPAAKDYKSIPLLSQ